MPHIAWIPGWAEMLRQLCSGLMVCAALICAGPAHADRVEKLEAAFTGWMQDHGATTGAIAITFQGELVHSAGFGMPADQPIELASVGKSITALCLNVLVEEGRLAWTMGLREALGRMVPAPLGDVTLKDLVTHAAGIGPDSTQDTMPYRFGDPTPYHDVVTQTVIQRDEQAFEPEKFRYNNENYAILGEVIARVTGRPYHTACAQRVLPKEQYPSARLSPDAGAFGPWGGWQMSVADYARFHAAHFGTASSVGHNPEAFPAVPIAGGMHYGLGSFWRAFRGRYNFWHLGLLCFDQLGAGAFAVSWRGDWGVVVAWDRCVSFDSAGQLDGALSHAAFSAD